MSGEKINLLSRLTISGKVNDIEDKIVNIIESCSSCNRLAEKHQIHLSMPLRQLNDENKTPTIMEEMKNYEKNNSIFQSFLPMFSQKNLNTQNHKESKLFSKTRIPTIEETNESGINKILRESEEYESKIEEVFQNCTCIKSFHNYKSTKLRLTYLAYVKFLDGTNSLLKTETVWNIVPELPIIIFLHIKDKNITLENSIDLNVIIQNNINQELELRIDENSFNFIYSKNDKNFGALILENKLARTIYVPPLSQDTVMFSFMPVKSGFIELQSVVFYDIKLKKNHFFKCDYKIFIN